MRRLVQDFARDEAGATAIEYALVASLVSIIIVGACMSIGTSLVGKIGGVQAAFAGAGEAATP
jgi:pilus assembly protein Flp/PilA